MVLPKISIVTPSLNQAEFVEETIASVLDQRYENLEYVVIDGGSTDGSKAIIERYLPRLHYYVSEPDTGHGNALSKGFRQTTGEIMGWLNSDDKYLPWTLKTVAQIFQQFPEIRWITGTQGFFNEQGALIFTAERWKNVFDFLTGNFQWIQQESVFWRRSLWEQAGGYIDESYKFMVDGELWCRFFAIEELWHVRSILAGYRMHGTNRAILRQADCMREMERAIGRLRERIDMATMSRSRANYVVLDYDFTSSIWAPLCVRRSFTQ